MKTSLPQFSIEIQRDDVDVAMMSPSRVPDSAWRYVDAEEHGHFWEGTELPTLHWVITGTRWAGDEIDGEEYEVGEWRCKQCEEAVEPRKKAEYGPRYLAGPPKYIITIGEETFSMGEQEYAESLTAWAEQIRRAAGRA